MPRRCCVPNCKGNYDSILEDHNYLSIFLLPKNEELRKKWVAAIPRKNWTPTKYSAVCSLHFAESDIQRYQTILSPSGALENVLMSRPKLMENAVPSIFHNCPSYLSKAAIQKRKDPQERTQSIIQAQQNEIQESLDSDVIQDFAHLINAHKEELVISTSWSIRITSSTVYFCMLACDDNSDFLTLHTQIVISSDMKLQVLHNGNNLSSHDLHWVLPIDKIISRWSQLQNLLSRYSTTDPTIDSGTDICFIERHLEKSLEVLNKAYIIAESIDYDYTKNLEIVIDQIRQMKSKKNRYKSCTIIMAFSLYTQSPATYNILQSFLILPHKRYLQYLSSNVTVTPDNDARNENYLTSISSSFGNKMYRRLSQNFNL